MTTAIPADAPLRILVPLDGSDQARGALDVATRLQPGCLGLLRVEQEGGFIPDVTPGTDDTRLEEMRNDLESLAAPLRANNVQVDVLIRTGEPGEQIVDAGSEYDLIALTTRGRGAAGRAIFGSVADHVSRTSTVPTLLIRRGADQEFSVPERIIVPLDGSAIAESALPMAARLARLVDCPVHLMRAIDLDDVRAMIRSQRAGELPAGDESFDGAREAAERDARAYLQTQAEALRASSVQAEIKLLDGTPSFALLWEITSSDLVVMSSHGLGGYRRLILGSVAEKLVRESSAPVVVVPSQDTAREAR